MNTGGACVYLKGRTNTPGLFFGASRCCKGMICGAVGLLGGNWIAGIIIRGSSVDL